MSKDDELANDEGDAEDAGAPPSFEGVIIEDTDGSADDGAGGGLELDAQQAAEIRQIFLTSLPDYLEPMKEMVTRLSSEPDETGEIKGGLAKTIASIGAAAERMKLDDIVKKMEALREDVVLFGDSSEPPEAQAALRERIQAAIAGLDELARRTATSVRPEKNPSETIVAALKGSDVIDNAAIQKLMAAGVVYVDQVLNAEKKEVAMVSGLDAATVARLFEVLGARRTSSALASVSPKAPNAPSKAEGADYTARLLGLVDDSASRRVSSLPLRAESEVKLPSIAPRIDALGLLDARLSTPPARPAGGLSPPEPIRSREVAPEASAAPRAREQRERELRARVDDELALEEARGEATRLNTSIRALRREQTMLERDCADLRAAIDEAGARAISRLASITRAESARSGRERERKLAEDDLEIARKRLAALEAERRALLEQVEHLTSGTASLTKEVANVSDVARAHSRSDGGA